MRLWDDDPRVHAPPSFGSYNVRFPKVIQTSPRLSEPRCGSHPGRADASMEESTADLAMCELRCGSHPGAAGASVEESTADLAMFGSGLVIGQTLGTDYGL